jgi:SAM-dependent methyltransferase
MTIHFVETLLEKLPLEQRAHLRRLRHRLLHPAWLGTIHNRTAPLSSEWGSERGTLIDRYYIEHFLNQHREDICGHVIEIKDSSYTDLFGVDVQHKDVLDINPANPHATVIADLCAADAVAADQFDCFILTQTLHLIYDIHAAVSHVHRMLRPGGVLLATVPVISRIVPRYGLQTDYWRFTTASCNRLFGDQFGPGQVTIQSYGNVSTAIAFLAGMAREELPDKVLASHDDYFPMLVSIRAVKQ